MLLSNVRGCGLTFRAHGENIIEHKLGLSQCSVLMDSIITSRDQSIQAATIRYRPPAHTVQCVDQFCHYVCVLANDKVVMIRTNRCGVVMNSVIAEKISSVDDNDKGACKMRGN